MMPVSENKTFSAFLQIILSKCVLVATNDPEIYSNFRTNILQRFFFGSWIAAKIKIKQLLKLNSGI